MPYYMHYEPPPTNMGMKVHKELPVGVRERERLLSHLREADGIVNDAWLEFHFCPDCDGWIEGHAQEFKVNTLDGGRLSGRRGTEYFCRRCGYQIAFMGIMS